MAELSADQLADMQGDIGIGDDEAVFTDAELNRLYARAGESYALAVFYGYRQLLAQANKFYSYTSGLTSEKKKEIRDNIKDSMEFWKEEAQEEAQAATSQVKMVGMRRVPPSLRDEPHG
jgi:hypothetical protein